MPDFANPQTWLDLGAQAAAHASQILTVVLIAILWWRGKSRQVIEKTATFAADLCRLLRDRPTEWAAAKGPCGESDPNTLVHSGTGFTLRLDEQGAVSVVKPNMKRLSRAERAELSAAYQSALTRQLESSAAPVLTPEMADALRRFATGPGGAVAARINGGPVKQV